MKRATGAHSSASNRNFRLETCYTMIENYNTPLPQGGPGTGHSTSGSGSVTGQRHPQPIIYFFPSPVLRSRQTRYCPSLYTQEGSSVIEDFCRQGACVRRDVPGIVRLAPRKARPALRLQHHPQLILLAQRAHSWGGMACSTGILVTTNLKTTAWNRSRIMILEYIKRASKENQRSS